MSTPLINFNQLSNSIREKAIRDIEQNLPDTRLVKWRKLRTLTLECELAMHRLKSGLKLLRTIPPRETLNMLSMSEGAWIDYHFGTWAFWMHSLIEKEIELISQVGQKLIKPNNPQYKDIVKPVIKLLVSQKDKVGKIRHPLAHKGEGGIIESVMDTNLWKDFVILPSPIDYNHVLDSYVKYHAKWYQSLYAFSAQELARIEQISGEIFKHIDWSRI